MVKAERSMSEEISFDILKELKLGTFTPNVSNQLQVVEFGHIELGHGLNDKKE